MLLRFEFVTNLRIDMDFGKMAGEALLWDAEAKQISESDWQISLDFGGAPEGSITFACSDICYV